MEESGIVSEIRALMEAYLTEAQALEKNRKPGEGLFGFGKKPADDPCHVKMILALKEKFETAAETQAPSADVRTALEYVYGLAKAYQNTPSMHIPLIGAHGSTLPAIPLLNGADAAALLGAYIHQYRRRERLPVQKLVIRALEARK